MKKNFLLLFLMALLPLSSFADNIKITPVNASKTYGDADPTEVKATWFDWTTTSGTLPVGVVVSSTTTPDDKAIDQQLTFVRVALGENVGSYTYTFDDEATVSDGSNLHNLLIMGSGQFSIKQKSLTGFDGSDNNKITFAIKEGHEQYINGSTQVKPTADDIEISVDLAVNSLDGVLVEGTDFTITGYGTNTSVGPTAGTITIEGKGNYSGTLTFNFEIKGANIATLGLTPVYSTAAADKLTYDGIAKEPLVGKFTLGTLTAGTDFQIKSGSYLNNTNAGTATVVLEGIGNYSGEVTAEFPIGQVEVSADGITYTAGTAPQYTGSPLKPVGTFKVGTLDLAETDYEFTESTLDTDASTTNKADLTLKSTGNFKFASGVTKQEITYEIAKRIFNDGTVTASFEKDANNVEITQYEYNNEVIKPAVTVTFKPSADADAITLTTSDYDIVYANSSDATTDAALKAVGTGNKVTITGKGNNFTDASLTVKTYDVTVRTLTITTEELTVGMGADVAPVPVYGNFAKGENASKLGGSLTYSYKSGSNTYTQAQIKDAPVGDYEVIPNTSALSTTNYTYSVTNGVLHKIAGQVVVKVVDRTIDYGEAFPTTGWTVEHVSGLAEENQTGTNFSNIIGTLTQTNFAYVTAPDVTPVNANAEGYDVNYNNGSIANASYAITVLPGKLIVNKKAITSTMISIATSNYEGKAISPEVSITPATGDPALVSGYMPTNYYTTDYDESYNAGTRTAKISISGDGANNYVTATNINYTAEEATAYNTEHGLTASDPDYKTTSSVKEVVNYVEKTYAINKIALTITADNFTGDKAWTYGTKEPDYTAKLTNGKAVTGEEALITALLAGEQPEGFNGKLVVNRTGASTVGDHAGALVPSFVDEDGNAVAATAAADNYSFTLKNGNLTIKKGKIIAKVKDVTLPYGETPAKFQLEAVSGMDDAEAANFDDIVTYENATAKFGYTDDFKTIGEHTLTYAGTAPTATNYDVELAEGTAANGTLNVTKRPVTFKAVDKTVNYNALSSFTPAVNDTYVKLIGSTDSEYDPETCYTLLTGTDMTDLIASVAASSKNVGENDIVLTSKVSDIYEINLLKGTLTVTSTGVGDITLNRVVKASYDDELTNTAAKLIMQNDGKFVNVKFSDFPMLAEKWYPLVLPFATSVKDISKAFGYAVVDIFNGTNADGNIQFKLHMGNIEANTPFIVKVYEDLSMSDTDVKFENVKIENAGEEVKIGDAAGIEFVGTYKGKTDGFRSNMYYFSTNAALNEYYKGNDTNATYLRPLGAYFVDNSADAASANRMIIIEEPNGNTTKISAITAEGASVEADGWYTVSGVKLEGAPTEKGVYIRNGKKVVLK